MQYTSRRDVMLQQQQGICSKKGLEVSRIDISGIDERREFN